MLTVHGGATAILAIARPLSHNEVILCIPEETRSPISVVTLPNIKVGGHWRYTLRLIPRNRISTLLEHVKSREGALHSQSPQPLCCCFQTLGAEPAFFPPVTRRWAAVSRLARHLALVSFGGGGHPVVGSRDSWRSLAPNLISRRSERHPALLCATTLALAIGSPSLGLRLNSPIKGRLRTTSL